MPLHDWTRVIEGVWHDFHLAWITHLQAKLNQGGLPRDYYALSEGHAAEFQTAKSALLKSAQETAFYLALRRTLAIRETNSDRMVALVEMASPAIKQSPEAVANFVGKVTSAIRAGLHALLIDPFPPSEYDEHGLHAVVWEALGERLTESPFDRSLTLASYCAEPRIAAYVEPMSVGLPLTEVPLFLTRTHYIRTPLEPTYMQAWAGVPERWRRVIEG
jgi:hypothetical protein